MTRPEELCEGNRRVMEVYKAQVPGRRPLGIDVCQLESMHCATVISAIVGRETLTISTTEVGLLGL